MKLSQVAAKLTRANRRVLGLVGGVALAGAACTLAAPAANAQVSFGVAIGGPRYYAPVPAPVYTGGYGGYGYTSGYAPGYWAHRREEEWRARELRERSFYDRRAVNRYDDRHFDDHRFDNRGWR